MEKPQGVLQTKVSTKTILVLLFLETYIGHQQTVQIYLRTHDTQTKANTKGSIYCSNVPLTNCSKLNKKNTPLNVI